MKEIKDYTYSDIIQADEGKLEVINENLSNIDKMKEIKDFSFLDVEPEYEVKLGFIINELKRSADKYELNNTVLPIEVIEFIADNTTDYRSIESACTRLIVYANMDRIKNITLDMAKDKIFNNYFNKQIEKDIDNLNKNYTFENFKINDYNKFAYKVSLTTAKSSGNLYNPLFISANNKDKEHLLNAIGNYMAEHFGYNVIYLSAKQYIETTALKEIKNKYKDIDVLIIDDIECLAKNFEEQSQLLLWCDKLHHKNKQIVFGSNIQKDKLSDFNENLRNMFNWGISVDIVSFNSEQMEEDKKKQFDYNWIELNESKNKMNIENNIINMLETTSPYAFLKEKLGRTPSKDEVKILEYLLIDKQLIPSGVNLLVDYILKTHDNQLDIELTKKFANCFKNSSLSKINEYAYDWLDESIKDRTIKNILVNNFKHELIVYAIAETDTGHVALNCSTIRKSIQLGKKVLFYSLEQPKELMLKRIGLAETSNLLIQDKPLENIEEISTTLDNFKPDLLIIDRLELLTQNSKADNINVFYRIINKYNIPVIAVINLNQDDNKDTDFATITPDEFKSKNKEIFPIIQLSDRFIIFYKNSSKEYMVRELLNDFTGKPKEFDIRELLNED